MEDLREARSSRHSEALAEGSLPGLQRRCLEDIDRRDGPELEEVPRIKSGAGSQRRSLNAQSKAVVTEAPRLGMTGGAPGGVPFSGSNFGWVLSVYTRLIASGDSRD